MNLKTPLLLATATIILTAGTIDLNNLFDYTQPFPDYVSAGSFFDNEPANNQMDDKIATLGRVLFYDKRLSSDNTISCESCHIQEFAFGDTTVLSQGVNGMTTRQSMRLVNVRLSNPNDQFTWDQSVPTLEDFISKPIISHVEMGNSGINGAPDFDDLIQELESLDYYNTLFSFAFGDPAVTEDRIQKAIAQFIRSIQSFDSKYDDAFAQGADPNDILQPFPNFTTEENAGKELFFTPPQTEVGIGVVNRIGGGLTCGTINCHLRNSFVTNTDNENNGLITESDGTINLDLTRAPNFRDLFNPNGELNGPLFHDGRATTIDEVFTHYSDEIEVNPNLGPAFFSPISATELAPVRLNITQEERNQVTAFLKTLSGNDVYTNEKWSNPFDEQGNLELITGSSTCDDGIQNGDETGVDCGGSCPPCTTPTCDDGMQNGDEIGVDCGGSCPPCSSNGNCDDLDISTQAGQITINGLSAPVEIVQVFDEDWNFLFRCSGTECGANQTIADLNAGNYNVNVQMYTENWGLICNKDFAVNVGGESGDPSCDDVQVTGSNGQIQIDGLTAPVEIVQVFDEDWNFLFRCSGTECGANQTIADLNAGNYNVNVQMYTENWGLICNKDFAVNVGGESGNPSCDDVQVTGSNGQIQIDGLTAPIEVVRVFDMDNNWMQVFECNNDCGAAQTISNLSSNNYAVKVQMHNENWSWICESNTTISLDASANNRSSNSRYTRVSYLCQSTNGKIRMDSRLITKNELFYCRTCCKW